MGVEKGRELHGDTPGISYEKSGHLLTKREAFQEQTRGNSAYAAKTGGARRESPRTDSPFNAGVTAGVSITLSNTRIGCKSSCTSISGEWNVARQPITISSDLVWVCLP